MSRYVSRNALVWSALLLALAAAAIACGPWFPNRLLPNADISLVSAPAADFGREIDRVLPAGKPDFYAIRPREKEDEAAQSARIDGADLKTALSSDSALLAAYQEFRRKLPALDVPAGLPKEFDLYAKGLLAYRRDNLEAARSSWTALLQLPAEQRRNKTVWAAFMIGKSYLQQSPDKSPAWFADCRKLAASGFSDSLGLAASSLGWEAQADLKTGRYADVFSLYLRQQAAGDTTAIPSLNEVARIIIEKHPDQLSALAADANSRNVITAYIAAHSDDLQGQNTRPMTQWLEAVAATNPGPLRGADRLAWAAYQVGDSNLAEHWVKLAPDDSPIRHWISAKLLIHSGKTAQAAEELARTINAFPLNEEWPNSESNDGPDRQYPFHPRLQAQAELAVLRLARRQYADSLLLFMNGGFWEDAAYVADRVLTADELIHYLSAGGEEKCTDAFGDEHSLNYLAARRLARLSRFDQARPLYPAAMRDTLDQYTSALRSAGDVKQSQAQRAAALWSAAQIARAKGMELFGTEGDPDNFDTQGDYTHNYNGSLPPARPQPLSNWPGKDEQSRAAASLGELHIQQRFEYRYVAADLAWSAAASMPDESDQTAAVLNEAGGWLKGRDPKAADKFYKAMVSRCGSTKLGQLAKRAHWFPTTLP